jgi:hypothetical protein
MAHRFYVVNLAATPGLTKSPLSLTYTKTVDPLISKSCSPEEVKTFLDASAAREFVVLDFNELFNGLNPSLARSLWYMIARSQECLPPGTRPPNASVIREICTNVRDRIIASAPKLKGALASLVELGVRAKVTPDRELTPEQLTRIHRRAERLVAFDPALDEFGESPVWSPFLGSFQHIELGQLHSNWLVQFAHDLYESGRYGAPMPDHSTFPLLKTLSRSPRFFEGDELVFTVAFEASGEETPDPWHGQLVLQHSSRHAARPAVC